MLGRALTLLGLAEEFCVLCGGALDDPTQGYLCRSCLADLKPSHPLPYGKLDYISGYGVFGRYEDALAEVIRLIKFKSVKPLALRLGEALSSHLGEYISQLEPDILTYVPVHTLRFWNRGFDHNEEILAGAGLDFTGLLLRRRHAKPLARLKREERARAVKDAFGVKKNYIDYVEGRSVLVFDDILTTGATAKSVAEPLLSLGAREVFFYFVAKEG
ncbi:ComF family protein [Hydrogenivirga sp.]